MPKPKRTSDSAKTTESGSKRSVRSLQTKDGSKKNTPTGMDLCQRLVEIGQALLLMGNDQECRAEADTLAAAAFNQCIANGGSFMYCQQQALVVWQQSYQECMQNKSGGAVGVDKVAT